MAPRAWREGRAPKPEGGVAEAPAARAAEGAAMEERPVPIRPPEEIIRLDAGDGGSVPTLADQGDFFGRRKRVGGPSAGGRGSGGKGAGKGEDDRPSEPKLAKPKMGAGLRKFSRPGVERRPPSTQDKKLNSQLKNRARQDREAVFRLIKGEVLQTAEAGFLEAEGREKTSRFSQAQLLDGAAVGIAKKRYTFDLPYGPYSCGFTSNGQHLLGGGRKGHITMMHCDTMQISAELHVKETVRAIQALHNQTMFAVAQRKYVYIYDNQGIELHCLKDHKYPTHLEFLPYHYLLVAAGEMADLHYRDISTGKEVCCHKTRLGPARSLRQNPRNAVIHLGHSNGTVTLWTPTVKAPVVKVLAHNGHVTALGVHGDYMVTAGAEGFWKIWDLRKYEVVNTWKSFGHSVADLDVSMTGLVAVGFGSHLQLWRDAFNHQRPHHPYLTEEYPGKVISSVRFRPYEDVCGVGHTGGFGGIVVPGAGFANFDSYEANPFETKKQRREKEVRSLLEKLQPDSIMLDPTRIGNVDKKIVTAYMKEVEQKQKEEEGKKKPKKKMRGKNKVGNRLKRKHLKEGAEQRGKAKERLTGEGDSNASSSADDEEHPGGALGRFYGKRRRKT